MPATASDHSRCFIALGPDDCTRARLAALGANLPPARLLPADLHLTLAFLGSLTPDHEIRLRAALAPLARALPVLDGESLELWPQPARPRVAVASFSLPAPLRRLVEDTQTIVRGMGLPVEGRPFRPHVTLARFKAGQSMPDLPRPMPAIPPARFGTLGLYASAPAGSELRYAALFRFDLA